MKILSFICAVFVLAIWTSTGVGQEEKTESSLPTASDSEKPGEDTAAVSSTGATPVPLKNNAAELSPKNTKVEFVGIHVGPKPDPRFGGFEKFSGSLQMNSDGKSIKSLMLEFETGSMFTRLGKKLTGHLKSADFLNVKKFPKSKFVSTEISEPDSNGMVNITGDFTLMGETKEITLPSMLKVADSGVLLTSELEIDRTDFGMNKMTAKVAKNVSIKLSVGEKTVVGKVVTKATGNAAGANRDRSRGGFDPDALFKRWDANGDGELTGREIPPRMRQQMGKFDSNGDGKVGLQEWQTSVRGQ